MTQVRNIELELSGADVMITIFCEFCQFSAKKLAYFSNTTVLTNFLQKLAVVLAKNAIFSLNFVVKIFKKS
jgi:hypothetical protein